MSEDFLDTIVISLVMFVAFVVLVYSFFVDDSEQQRYRVYMERRHGITVQDQ